MTKKQEVFVSVDVESSGPIPGEFSMLTLGACLVDSPSISFSMELQPLNGNFDAEALAVTGLSMEDLARTGMPPTEGMGKFASWITMHVAGDATPVFVGLNASFDWSFVNYYFHRFVGANPFGFAALDIKALFMGATACDWQETKSSSIAKVVHPSLKSSHDALDDARYQAELFRLIRKMVASRSRVARQDR